ncbi:pirin [Azospirillum sp. TSA2s]|uniref:replication protein RepA n=1 Tax=Azospirillum sp. TSA2s TaxID=709810 RepID=UPI0010AAB225|nr:replication protein RepA [Azospirillum sp. TSA2s]QCG94499.1 pirin [Azospirillum sp. TSA2s]
MRNIHKLLIDHGLEAARELVVDKAERRQLEIAAAVLAEESETLGICHAGFALTSLPHKDIIEPFWRREGHRITLMVESGRDRQGNVVGIPYGSKARMILIYLQTQAVRTRCREVELGGSLKGWMKNMGMASIGGATYKMVTEQARRISACRLTFFTDHGHADRVAKGAFVEEYFDLAGMLNDDNQPTLWQDKVTLNDAFYRSLIDHPVPVSETALREIGNKSMAIDIYVWLAYRLHSLCKPTPVSWPALMAQFGAGFNAMRNFKPAFTEALRMALAAYPDAKVQVESTSITLYPSAPPIAKSRDRLGVL